jgi:hypothetical protein
MMCLLCRLIGLARAAMQQYKSSLLLSVYEEVDVTLIVYKEVDVTMMVNHLVIMKCYFGSNWDLDQHEEVD